MPTRPKQRVLVRWNDDLDKALLLFITHICAESGIKIPYDEVARRMGSTFTEGAITQHLSKLRTKMAELNVVPVPDAPKRGAVTNKPSSVYAQKGRAGPPLPQPVASKTQARQAASRTAANGVAKKRSTKRKTGFIKRSESDDGQTDDEFDGESDDDFGAGHDAGNKRKRGADGRRDQANRQVTAAEEQQARTNQFVNESIENMTGRGFDFHYGQLSQSAGYEEEEEDHRIPQIARTPSSFAMRQHATISPTDTSQMPTHISNPTHYTGPHAFRSNVHQMSHALAPSLINFAADQTTGGHNNYFPVISHADSTDNDRSTINPTMMAANVSRAPMTNVGGQYDSHAHMVPGAIPAPRTPGLNFNNYHSFVPAANSTDNPGSHTPQAAVMPLPNYSGTQPMTRNGSMTSSNSQATYSSPMTPMMPRAGGLDNAQRSPFNFGANQRSPVANSLPSFHEPAATIQSMNTEMGYDGQNDMFDFNTGGSGEHVLTNGDQFAQELFY